MTIEVRWEAGTGPAWTGADTSDGLVTLFFGGRAFKIIPAQAKMLSDELQDRAEEAEKNAANVKP